MSNTSLLGSFGGLGNAGLQFRNKIINGDMRIDQRNSGSLVAGDVGDTYGVDRTVVGVFGSGSGRMSAQRVEDAPSEFVYSLKAIVTTTDTSQTEFEGYCVQYRIEGNDISDFQWESSQPKPVTISFWVKSSIAGSYVLGFQSGAGSQDGDYNTKYTINSSNTWEKKTITIPGPTIGGWNRGNGRALVITWGLGGGSARQAVQLDSWYSKTDNYTTTDAAGCVDFIANSGATFQITGVQLEAGPVATPFEHRPINLELSLAQRYYQHFGYENQFGGGFYNSPTGPIVPVRFTVPMRVVPTLRYSALSDLDLEPFDIAPTTIGYAVGTSTNQGVSLALTDPTARTTGFACVLYVDQPDGYIAFDAEL